MQMVLLLFRVLWVGLVTLVCGALGDVWALVCVFRHKRPEIDAAPQIQGQGVVVWHDDGGAYIDGEVIA